MNATLICDVTVALLLVATIGYAAVLNRRLAVLRDDRAKLEQLIQGLNVASVNAQNGIAGLRKATEDVGKDLEKELAASRSLRDDLHYLIERGGVVADRLEGSIRSRREDTPRIVEAPAPRAASSGKVAQLRAQAEAQEAPSQISRAERELLRALGGRR